MGKLTLKDGKFWRDGVEVPPRIGDAEQIALLQQAEREAEQREIDANGDGIELEFSIEELRYTGQITCICGKVISNDFECNYFGRSDSFEDVMTAACDSHCMKCPKCGREYEIVYGRAVLIHGND
ncbi:hypothetical protein [uncultured Rikenella sp.]|uniref:hypothetical protein n=1 Tax=uncultured Rikenella sp. TaxID=368003 RepID=UPI0026004648|nr:hypothetical protein [uncultured Rikenella sp.]